MMPPGWEDPAAKLAREWAGMHVVTDPYCPKDKVYVISPNYLVTAPIYDERRRFWYKPWTWLRKNTYAAPWYASFKAMSRDEIIAKYDRPSEWKGAEATFIVIDELADVPTETWNRLTDGD